MRVFKIQHPSFEFLKYNRLQNSFWQSFVLSIETKSPGIFQGFLVANFHFEYFNIWIQAAISQFQVIKETIHSSRTLIVENSDVKDISKMLEMMSKEIQEIFPKLPKNENQLTELQKMILSTLALHYPIASINSNKRICSSRLGNTTETASFMRGDFEVANPILSLRIRDIMHAISSCIAYKVDQQPPDLVVGASHNATYLNCFNIPYTETYHPSKLQLEKSLKIKAPRN